MTLNPSARGAHTPTGWGMHRSSYSAITIGPAFSPHAGHDGIAAHLEGAKALVQRVVGQESTDQRIAQLSRINLMVSIAWIDPTMPGSTPSTPASAQLGASSAGGGSGIMQR